MISEAKIISLNSGHPENMEWKDRAVVSSMRRHSVEGPLVVHEMSIEGNSFASPEYHGREFSVLYAFGMTSAKKYLQLLGRDGYESGALGENLTLDSFDEDQVSVGDVFKIGEVIAQATFPRIPCDKVNIRMEHPQGRKLLEDCGCSGVYFRILKPGLIYKTDKVRMFEAASVRIPISSVYRKVIHKQEWTAQDIQQAQLNGGLPKYFYDRWKN